MRQIELQVGDYCHVFNRGAGKQLIFRDKHDYRRFYQSMFLFNNKNFRNPGGYTEMRDEVLLMFQNELKSQREPFVDIVSFCLLPNHYHLLLKQRLPNGIPLFLHKLAMGYSKYFNLRYKRTGTLYEGPYKAIIPEREGHLEHLPRYIHLNALDLTSIDWRSTLIDDWVGVVNALNKYPWSSHHVFINKKQRLDVVSDDEVKKIFPEPETYWKYIKEWVGTSPGDVPVSADVPVSMVIKQL